MKDQISRIFKINSAETSKDEIKEIDMNLIVPNPYQPRRNFDQAHLDELAQSIKQYGVLQPIILRKVGQNYEIVAGERRFRASQILNLKTITAIIRDLSDSEIAEMALIENLQRQDLNFFEEAEGYAKLITEFSITQEEIAAKIGKSQSTVANKLRLLNLAPQVRQQISVEVITERHARALLKLENAEQQLKILKKIYEQNLNVRQTDELIEASLIKSETIKKERIKRKITKVVKDMRIFLNTIRGAVQTIQNAGMDAEISERENEEDCLSAPRPDHGFLPRGLRRRAGPERHQHPGRRGQS